MSYEIMQQCYPIQVTPTQKAVLMALADMADQGGICWCAIALLVQRTCLCDKAVRSALSDLSKMGFLVVKTQPGRSSSFIVTPVPDTEVPRYLLPDYPGTTYRTPRHDVPDTPVGNTDPYIEPPINHQLTIGEKARKAPREKKPKGQSTRRTQIPDGFLLTIERETYLREQAPAANPALQFAKFCDYHRAKGSTMADWDAAWRTWCRNAAEFAKRSPGGSSGGTDPDRPRRPHFIDVN